MLQFKPKENEETILMKEIKKRGVKIGFISELLLYYYSKKH